VGLKTKIFLILVGIVLFFTACHFLQVPYIYNYITLPIANIDWNQVGANITNAFNTNPIATTGSTVSIVGGISGAVVGLKSYLNISKIKEAATQQVNDATNNANSLVSQVKSETTSKITQAVTDATTPLKETITTQQKTITDLKTQLETAKDSTTTTVDSQQKQIQLLQSMYQQKCNEVANSAGTINKTMAEQLAVLTK
jgi:vacuolar-type H+-ATPase subunit H